MTSSASGRRRVTLAAILALLAMACGLVALLVQVEVTSRTLGTTRTCGSAFDSLVDRSGWELWWARDLDEPDSAMRSALVRTTACPGAVNARTALAVALGSVGVILAALAGRHRARQMVPVADPVSSGRRVARLGLIVTVTGAVFALAGVVAVIVLVADAESTLFLYTDRLVVGVVGLIVLVPTLALFAIGRLLMIVGPEIDRQRRDDDPEEVADG